MNETISTVAQNLTGNETIGSAFIYATDKLGVGITQLVTIYAKVQAMSAVVDFATSLAFWGLFGFIGMFFFLVIIPRCWNKMENIEVSEKEKEMYMYKTIAYCVIWLVAPFLVAGLIATVGQVYLKTMYPDYYAIQQLLGQFQAMK